MVQKEMSLKSRDERRVRGFFSQLSPVNLTADLPRSNDVFNQFSKYRVLKKKAKENGTGGTEHGTASGLFLAGGTVKSGKVNGKWSGLA
jgi:hypothetical protein